MAHGVKRGHTIKLHQALHGYAEGHRQLAVSVPLKKNDVKTMLVVGRHPAHCIGPDPRQVSRFLDPGVGLT